MLEYNMQEALIQGVSGTVCQGLRPNFCVRAWVVALSCAQQASLSTLGAFISLELLVDKKNAHRLSSKVIPPCWAVSYWLNTWVRAHRIHLLISLNPDKMQAPAKLSATVPLHHATAGLDWLLWMLSKQKTWRLCAKLAGMWVSSYLARKEYCGSYRTWGKSYILHQSSKKLYIYTHTHP